MLEREQEVRLQSNLDFRLMALFFKFRDLFMPPVRVLNEVEIKAGFRVLDYGCGPGSYILPLVKKVGDSGIIYALDIHPLAVQMVRDQAEKNQLSNVNTILSDCKTGLPDNSLDMVLLFDILHDLNNSGEVLWKLYRVLRPGGNLVVADHHTKEGDIIFQITKGDFFRLLKKGERTISFSKG